MKSSTLYKPLIVVTASCALFFAVRARAADDATVKLYQTKCAACHGPDGSGNTPVGKTLKIKDVRDPESQKMTDDELTTLIAKGKDKMPANEKTLKPDQIKALVGYVHELAQKK
jgi:mono/diheme cytochrome c family protein